jgi:antitoxin component HigA of HigAB toxin-antitoxin module
MLGGHVVSNVFTFPSGAQYQRAASAMGHKPNSRGSGAGLPDRSKKPAKTKYHLAGMRDRALQLETTLRSTPANCATADGPPKADTTSSTVVSTDCEYSPSVKMSTGHAMELAESSINGASNPVQSVKQISARLAATQAALGLRSAEVCRQIGITPNRWSQYVNGKRPLTLDVADRLCTTYGLTLDWLYRGNINGIPHAVARKIRAVA